MATRFGLGPPAAGPLGFGAPSPAARPASTHLADLKASPRPTPQAPEPTLGAQPRPPAALRSPALAETDDGPTSEGSRGTAELKLPWHTGPQGVGPVNVSAPPLTGFLVSFQDDSSGRFWPLRRGRNRVGRADTGQAVDVAIPHGTTSTNHAVIDCQEPRITVADLGSTNGTFHNEQAVGFQGKRELRDGDRLRFGGFTVILVLVEPRV